MPLRDLPPELVPTPDQLLEKLSSLQGVELPKSSNQRLMELGQRMLEGMSDEQKAFFQNLAEQMNQGGQPTIPPEFRDFAEELQANLSKDDVPLDVQELFREFSRQKNTSPSMEPLAPSNPGGSASSKPSSTKERANRNQKTESITPLRDRLNRRSRGNNLRPPREQSQSPETNAEELADRISQSMKKSTDQEAFTPDPSWFEPRSATQRGTGQSVGNRFDRMILEAVNNQLNEAGDSRSELAESVEGLFSGALDRVHRALNGRDWTSESRSVTSRSKPRSSKARSESVWSGVANRVGARDFEFGSAFVNLLVWAAGFALTAVLIWLGIGGWMKQRERGSGNRRRSIPGKIRTSRVTSGPELVQATDHLLLSRFGTPSRWWHAGRAEQALKDATPSLQDDVQKLVTCYEFARYSEVKEGLSEQELKDCRSILSMLARQPIRREVSQESDEA